MRALRLLAWKSDPVVVDVEDPVPDKGQVVIRVGGAGACHSDLHLMRHVEGGALPWAPPFTLGHENAGWVHALGPEVEGLEIGEPVAVYGPWGCGSCSRCALGMESYCETPAKAPVPMGGGGLGLDGGMAEFMLVPAVRHLVRLPQGLHPALAAPLTDAGLTPYHAVRRSAAKLTPGAAVVVIGVGGLGHMAVQILAAISAARIIAVDNREEALTLAANFGADTTVVSGPGAAAEIRAATRGRGADVVLDFVGSDATLALAVAIARPLGDITIVGIAGGTLPVSFVSVPHEVSIQTTYWGFRSELQEILDLAARGLVKPMVTTFTLDTALDAYRAMEAGRFEGRLVVDPSLPRPSTP